jgi:hypothetical protein
MQGFNVSHQFKEFQAAPDKNANKQAAQAY